MLRLWRFNASSISIFFAFVFSGRCDAIIHGVGMQHYRAEVKEKETETPPGRRDGGQEHKDPHRDRASHPEKAHQDMSLVDVSQSRNDTEHNRYCVASFAFRSVFSRAALPIAPVAVLCVLWQEMPAEWTRHFVRRGWFGSSRRCVRVFHLHFTRCRAF